MWRILAALFATVIAAGPALAADAAVGAQLVQRWCVSCHVVGGAGRGTDLAPPLPVIAKNKGRDQSWVRAWLEAPHPPMPDFNLSRPEIDDIVAYLESLAAQQP